MNDVIKKTILKLNQSKFSSSILELAKINKWETQNINNSEKSELKQPNLIGGAEHNLFQKDSNISYIRDRYLVCIKNAKIKCGYVLLGNGHFISENSLRDNYWTSHPWKLHPILRLKRPKTIKLDGDVYFLDNVFSHTYGHHLTDDLPRLLAVKDRLPTSTRYVVVAPLRDLKIKTLTALGVNMENVIVVQGDDKVICERLWYINPLEDITWFQKDVFDLREKLLSAYCSEGEASPRRIFISRNNIDHRRLENEEEILPILENYNFTIHYPERMKFEDQINSFKNAEIVTGAYGGGLINMIFSKNAKILELQDDMYAHRPWHWKLASLLGNPYYCLFGPLKNYDNHILQYGPPENCRGYLNTPFVINPDMLKSALDKIISD